MGGINLSPTESRIFRIVQAIIGLSRGQINAVGSVTLRTTETTTTVDTTIDAAAENVGPDAAVFLSPLTANAAAIVASVYISAVASKQFTITHPSSADVDLSFRWVALG